MIAEALQCPLCTGHKMDLLVVTKDYFVGRGNSPEFSIMKCNNCTCATTYPPLNNNEMSPYYPKDYEAYSKRSSLAAVLQTVKYAQDISKIEKARPISSADCFEIGAGRGEFLNELKKKAGSVSGAEPSEEGCKNAKTFYGIDLQNVFAEQIQFSKPFDIVVMRHVLEHVENPIKTLKSIHANGLTENGILFIKIPRLNSWEASLFGKFWGGFDVPRHRFHFSDQGIRKLLSDVGFGNIDVSSECVPTDIIRSVDFYLNFSKNSNAAIKTLWKYVPHSLRIILMQAIGYIMSPFKSGRIIITAQKIPIK